MAQLNTHLILVIVLLSTILPPHIIVYGGRNLSATEEIIAIDSKGNEKVYDVTKAESQFQEIIDNSVEVKFKNVKEFQPHDTITISNTIEIKSETETKWKCPSDIKTLFTIKNEANVKLENMKVTGCAFNQKNGQSVIIVKGESKLKLKKSEFDYPNSDANTIEKFREDEDEYYKITYVKDGSYLHISDKSEIEIIDCQFSNGIVNSRGGAIYAENSSLKISDTKFEKNTAEFGGSIHFKDCSVETENCKFNDNYVWGHGGSFLLDNTNLKDKKSKFENNESYGDSYSLGNGGAIFTNYSSVIELKDTVFKENSADRGGAIYAYQAIINGDSVTFEKNSGSDGAALHATRTLSTYYAVPEDLTITFVDTVFKKNEAETAAAIYADENQTVICEKCVFDNNEALYGAGAVYLIGSSEVYLYSNTFKENSAKEFDGGAIFVSNNGYLEVNQTEFKSNSAGSDGGAILLNTDSKATITKCNFEKNSAVDNGGAIDVDADAELILIDSTFSDNVAGGEGDDIYYEISE